MTRFEKISLTIGIIGLIIAFVTFLLPLLKPDAVSENRSINAQGSGNFISGDNNVINNSDTARNVDFTITAKRLSGATLDSVNFYEDEKCNQRLNTDYLNKKYKITKTLKSFDQVDIYAKKIGFLCQKLRLSPNDTKPTVTLAIDCKISSRDPECKV